MFNAKHGLDFHTKQHATASLAKIYGNEFSQTLSLHSVTVNSVIYILECQSLHIDCGVVVVGSHHTNQVSYGVS